MRIKVLKINFIICSYNKIISLDRMSKMFNKRLI